MRLWRPVLLSLLWFAAPASAADWPTRPTRILVPYGAGGGVDSFVRPIANELSGRLPQRIVVENRGGAGGTIAVLGAAQAEPDGATLLGGGVHQPMAEALYPKRGYRIDADFVTLAVTAIVPNVLVVPAWSRLATVRDLVEAARAAPGKLTYCSSGNGTSQHIIAEMFKRATGTEILHVPYRGTAAALTDLVAGVCDMMFDGMGTSAAQIEGNRLRPLALTTAARSRIYPDIPTMAEAGGPPLDAGTWYALWAPRAVPAETVGRIRAEIRAALADPAVQRTWRLQGAEVPAIPDGELDSFVAAETGKWTRTVTSLGIRAD